MSIFIGFKPQNMNRTPSSFVCKLHHITHLQRDNRQFYRIFALNYDNFEKIILILPPAKPADFYDDLNIY
jgi:hypothetical protein